jgi:hypothetical protein
VLRRIFGPKSEEVAEGQRRLHNLYVSPSVIRMIKSRWMRWVEHVACMEDVRNAYKILDNKPEERKPLRRPRKGWKDNIRIDLREIGWECVNGCI